MKRKLFIFSLCVLSLLVYSCSDDKDSDVINNITEVQYTGVDTTALLGNYYHLQTYDSTGTTLISGVTCPFVAHLRASDSLSITKSSYSVFGSNYQCTWVSSAYGDITESVLDTIIEVKNKQLYRNVYSFDMEVSRTSHNFSLTESSILSETRNIHCFAYRVLGNNLYLHNYDSQTTKLYKRY